MAADRDSGTRVTMTAGSSLAQVDTYDPQLADGEIATVGVRIFGWGASGTRGVREYIGDIQRTGATTALVGSMQLTRAHFPNDPGSADWGSEIVMSSNVLIVRASPAAADNVTFGARGWIDAMNSTGTGIVATPSVMVLTGSTGNTINLVGTGVSWTPGTPGTPTFTVSAGTLTQVVNTSTTATLTYAAAGAAATITVTDPSSGTTATFPVRQTATAYTLTGPTTGTDGVASSNFTVALPSLQAIPLAATITPSDGGAGGTFTPATVQLDAYTLADSATFTYTPATSGAITISVTDNRGLTDPASIGMTVASNDSTAPVLTAFGLDTTYTVASVPTTINITTAASGTDAVGITNWWLGTSASVPALNDAGWTGSATAPTTISVTALGAQTWYIRARDANGNISDALSDSTTIALNQQDYFVDLFNRANGAAGNGWTGAANPPAENGGPAVGVIAGNRLQRTENAGYQVYYNNAAGALPADYYVSWDVPEANLATPYEFVIGRMVTTTGVQFGWQMDRTDFRFGAGALSANLNDVTPTVDNAVPASWAANQNHQVALRFNGTTVSIYLDGVLCWHFTASTNNTTGTSIAIAGQGINLYWDNCRVTDYLPTFTP